MALGVTHDFGGRWGRCAPFERFAFFHSSSRSSVVRNVGRKLASFGQGVKNEAEGAATTVRIAVRNGRNKVRQHFNEGGALQEQQPVREKKEMSENETRARQELKSFIEELMPQLWTHGISEFRDIEKLLTWVTAEQHRDAGWSDDEKDYLIQFNYGLLELAAIDPATLVLDAAGTPLLTREQQAVLADPLLKLLEGVD
jgi:hypothetical protein